MLMPATLPPSLQAAAYHDTLLGAGASNVLASSAQHAAEALFLLHPSGAGDNSCSASAAAPCILAAVQLLAQSCEHRVSQDGLNTSWLLVSPQAASDLIPVLLHAMATPEAAASVAQVAGSMHGLAAPPVQLFHALLGHGHSAVRVAALEALLDYSRKVPRGVSCAGFQALVPPALHDPTVPNQPFIDCLKTFMDRRPEPREAQACSQQEASWLVQDLQALQLQAGPAPTGGSCTRCVAGQGLPQSCALRLAE